MSYTLLDSGGEQKLEQFGDYTLIRPCAQALWKKKAPKLWKNAQASFTRGKPWKGVPKFWQVEFNGLTFFTMSFFILFPRQRIAIKAFASSFPPRGF